LGSGLTAGEIHLEFEKCCDHHRGKRNVMAAGIQCVAADALEKSSVSADEHDAATACSGEKGSSSFPHNRNFQPACRTRGGVMEDLFDQPAAKTEPCRKAPGDHRAAGRRRRPSDRPIARAAGVTAEWLLRRRA
jgi:hypothetical protein